jgi:hypothetical protein
MPVAFIGSMLAFIIKAQYHPLRAAPLLRVGDPS